MQMATTAQTPHASRLQVLPGSVAVQDAPEDRRTPLRLVRDHAARSILVAGSDARRRSKLLAQLTARLPEGTVFQEATATWEVLEHAPSSRMVMIAGHVEGSSTESVMHLLGNRHPQLPVLAFGEG
jgi:hypothetical protein